MGIVHTDSSIVQIEIHVLEKLSNHAPVTSVAGQVLVELRRDSSDLPQVVPWGVGKVVVLKMVAQVQVENVPNANIVVGLLSFDKLIVFSDDVDGCWMRAD